MDSSEEKDLIDFKKYLRILTKYWYIGVGILAACYFIAFLKIRYITPIYSTTTTIQIKDKSSFSSNNKNFLEGSSMFQPFKNLKNEIELIKSYNRIQLVVKELDVTWNYVLKGNVRNIEAYKDAPIQIEADSSLILTNTPIHIKLIDDASFELTVQTPQTRLYNPFTFKYSDSINQSFSLNKTKFSYGELIHLGAFHFKILKTSFFYIGDNENECIVTARDLHFLTKKYKNKIDITESQRSSIINISSSGPIVAREVDFLSKLTDVYIRKELEEKNLIATNTINFIDSQLNIISDSLKYAEDDIQSYREKNKMFGAGQDAEVMYSQLTDLQTKKMTLEIQLRYYEYLKEYLYADKEASDLIAPSTININEGILTQLVSELIALYQQKNTLQYSISQKSPVYQTVLLKIKSTKEALIETTNNLVKTSKSSIADLNQRIQKVEKEMSKIPAKERNLLNIQRQQTINDNIYNYLLQKRAEASIARASNLSDAFVVESPMVDEFIQIAPITKKIYTNHILTGFSIIVLLTFVYGKFDNKVHNKEEVERILKIKALGMIPYISDSSENKNVSTASGRLTESFRSMRTNLQFLIQGKQHVIIGVTSCISGDGKSFCSGNLARVYAISGKKTLLIRGDLRKEVSVFDYNLNSNAKGLSEYLIDAATIEQIIHPSDISDLSIIIPGPIPPNASELFASEKLETLLKILKTQFEVIIMDSPPVGLVSDYISIMNLMDINLYVIRQDFTPIASLEVIKDIKLKHKNAISHSIIYNGVKGQGSDGYYYGYGMPSPKSNKWSNMFKQKS